MTTAIRSKWRKTILGRSVSVFSRSDQKRIAVITIIQVALGFLDLVGIAVIGILGALAVNGVQSRQPGNRVAQILDVLNIQHFSFQSQIAILGVMSAFILITKTFSSVFFTRKILFFLSRRSAVISARLISRLLSQNLLLIQAKTSQETLFAVTTGVSAITLNVVGTMVSLVTDFSLLIILAIGLFVVDPSIAVGTILMFGFVGLVLYKLLQKRAQYLGYENSELGIKSNEKILEVLNSYREAVVRNRRGYYAREIGAARLDLANNTAEISFMPNISKYVIEATVVLGTLIICASQFLSQDSTRAVATLSIFLAAGTRIAPAVLRLQQGAIQIRSGLGSATPTLDLIERLGNSPDLMSDVDRLDLDHVGFDATLELRDITFTYPLKEAPAVSHVDLALQSGKSLAFVGPSGAGKTTIVDLLLGVLKPDQGAVTISGLDPLSSISKWAGAISYVPQDVMIANGTIRENVALGYPKQFATDELVWEALDIAQLNEFVRALPLGLETHVGERGAKISGGQRQRLGIARAMFTRPKLLVLDEATSSLDGKTESDIADSIHKLKGSVTVVMIAHRLSTVQDADYVAYMEDGRVISVGSFNEVRANVPNFDQQAAIMGLN